MESASLSDNGGIYSGKDEDSEDADSDIDIGADGMCIYDGADEYKIGKI